MDVPIPPLPRPRLSLSLAFALLAAFLVLPAQARSEPALWRVKGKAGTVYLFGTVHVLKPGLVWRSPKIDGALRSSDALWLEAVDVDDAALMQGLVMRYGLDPQHPLSTRLDAETQARFTSVLAGLGASPSAFDLMRPWLAGMALELLPLQKAGYDAKSGVELTLKTEARSEAKPVAGFETAEEQIRTLAEAPPAVELEIMKSSLDDADKAVSDLDALVAAWLAGDEATLEASLTADMRDKYPGAYRLLVSDRNQRFARKIAALADERGTAFVAIGALHLVGPDSVEADLAKLGYHAERR